MTAEPVERDATRLVDPRAPDALRRAGRRGVLVAVATSAATLVGISLGLGGDAEAVRTAVRVSGALSFALFLVAYSASALAKLRPAPLTRGILRYRRYVGVSFGLAHLIHAGGLFWLSSLSGRSFAALGPVLIALLLAGYVFVIAMLVTSNDRSQRLLGSRWRTLHLSGLHYVWLLFLVAYGRAASESLLYLAPLALVVAALALRVVARRRPAHSSA